MNNKHDYHWIKIDETKYWARNFLEWIGPDTKMIATYVFDRNSVTYCCELTPSYCLHLVGTNFETSRELSDIERESIEEKIMIGDMENDDIEYHHCSSITKSNVIKQFVDCDDDVTIDDVREYLQGNHV